MHRDGFISSIISSELHRVPPNWFLLLYWVPICTVMHRVAPWCTELALLTSELHRIAPNCFLLFYILLFCTMMHRDAPICTEYHRVGCMYFECTELHQAILLICTVMHRDAPRCTVMYRVPQSYYILYYLYLGKVTAIMRFCFSVHHGASRCITVHFSRYPL